MVPYEAFLSGEAGRDDARRRRPARGRPRPRDGARRRARRRRSSRAACALPRAAHVDEAKALGRAPAKARSPSASTWDALRRRAALRDAAMKVAYYSPLPPSRSGIADYSALLLPALRERVDVVVAEPGKRAPAADVALYHVGNDPDAHGWIVDALRKRPGVVVLHEYVLHHLIAGMTIGRGNGRGYLDAMERELGVAGPAARPRRARQPAAAALGDAARAVPALRRRPRPARRGLIVHSRLRRASAPARPATTGRSGGSRTRPGRTARSSLRPTSPATR